ncbi:triose-phosphate isomerase [Faecalicatena contorta]|uniref:triose-phosphate isomerase n=1 Tax=Faecalicatena contorta TaxID=39482 RepID=UPI001F3C1DE7|nr:triose-phosphate isomerase [Faecalicatena contorta]MCF2555413.1 triose-phosphate isomerase [Faecalicatena contorta]
MDKKDIEILVRRRIQELGLDMAGKKEYIIAANWKMNMSEKETKKFLEEVKGVPLADNIKVMIFPPYPYLHLFKEQLRYEKITYGAQDVAKEEKGAYTGEVSAAMLGDMGCSLTLVGHSERRSYYGDSSEIVAKKAKAALAYQITPVICIGETLEERQQDRYKEVLKTQLDAVYRELGNMLEKCIIAYEPVWAIGTGVIPTMDQIHETHKYIYQILNAYGITDNNIRVLYGGSVNAKNVQEIASVNYVNGFLIGGASLKAESFKSIIGLASEV